MLLIGAGLTLRTLINLQRVDPGFKTDNLLTMRIDLNFSKYKGAQIPAFWERLEERLRAVPGVLAAGGGGTFPLTSAGRSPVPLRIEGRELAPDAQRPLVDFYLATAGLLLHDRAAAPGRPRVRTERTGTSMP